MIGIGLSLWNAAVGAGGLGRWILATHFWRDNGRWIDGAVWKD